MKTWDEAFAPVAALGRERRSGQAQMGQTIIESFASGSSAIIEAPVGTGKTFATLVPMIDAILARKAENKSGRGVISTETLSLQNQVAFKDLPLLSGLYPGFTYRILKGRTNYLCLDAAKVGAIGDWEINDMYSKLEGGIMRLDTGEKYDVEKVLRREITNKQFQRLAGSSTFCADNKCTSERCFSTRAREKALTADIVVVNHALLQTDIDMKGGDFMGDGLLGPIDYLVVDEAHTLAEVLKSGWTETMTEWEINDFVNSMIKGTDKARTIQSDPYIGDVVREIDADMHDVLQFIIDFYKKISLSKGEDWDRSSHAVCEKWLSGSISDGLKWAMDRYETDVPAMLLETQKNAEKVRDYLDAALSIAIDQELPGRREMGKGFRACTKLLTLIDTLLKAMQTKNGVVFNYGVNYGIILDGWVRDRDKRDMCTLRFIPLDISSKAEQLWKDKSSILVSGTIADLQTGTFDYVIASLGFPECKTEIVDTPFDFATRQLIYITDGTRPMVDGSVFSLDELADVIKASQGRAMILFTSKRDLETADSYMRQRMANGTLPYFNLYVQDKDSDKQKLADGFRKDVHSVLFGLKSFFTGVDFPGETLSLAAAVRFPNPRYDIECRMLVEVWRIKGFPNWYGHKALEDFRQIVGRLIRAETDKGVFAMLDQRVIDPTQNVYKTAAVGISALGSPVTQDLNSIAAFLA